MVSKGKRAVQNPPHLTVRPHDAVLNDAAFTTRVLVEHAIHAWPVIGVHGFDKVGRLLIQRLRRTPPDLLIGWTDIEHLLALDLE
jgi:hypothetical protein